MIRPRQSPRRGFSLIWVLVLLTLTAAVSVEWARQIIMARQQAVATENALQAEWLARAGLNWAAVQIQQKGDKATLGKLPGDPWPGACDIKLKAGMGSTITVEAVATSGVQPLVQKRVLLQEWTIPKDAKDKPKPTGPILLENQPRQ